MLQRFFKRIAESNWFYYLIVCAILGSCVIVGIDTWSGLHTNAPFVELLDKILILIFVIEVIVKIGAEGRKPQIYFRDEWNVFDFLVTLACVISLIPMFTAFRIVRVLRVFRLFSTIPKLQLWVGALLRSLPSISYVFLLLIIIFFTYGAMGVYLFSANDPFHFGTLPSSLLSLFRVITLEDWTDIMYHNIFGSAAYSESTYSSNIQGITPENKPMGLVAAAFFVSFVLLCVFIILNMFTGIVLSAINEMRAELEEEAMKKAVEAIIGDKEEVFNDLPRVSPDDFEILTMQLNDIQMKLLEFKKNLQEK